uniref:Abnormal spindle-like microcephaly-associated protein ASH domain-containing protein n=1 Tax=Mola mola TaxID=94237 RepID=A0A3Q3VSZ0_MOLML
MSGTSIQRAVLDFSPGTRDNGNKENNVPTLRLIQFSKAPFLTFGTVKLGTSKSAVLQVENPTDDAEAEVTVEKIPAGKGFSVDHRTFTIQPQGSFSLTVTWTPAEEGGIRELIIFNANGVLKHQVVLLGRAEKLHSDRLAKIQRCYRRCKTQKTEKENRAAKVIQAVFKKWYNDKLSERTAAAIRIQSWYKMQKCLNQYRKIKMSTVFIQAQYRGHAQRRCFQMKRLQLHSALVIQRAFRGRAVRKQVANMKRATVIIQRWFRACVERDVRRQTFVQMRCAAITLQATYRGKVARKSLKRQHDAATVIQAAFRKYAAQKQYLLLRKAASVVQQKCRATILARKTKKDYVALRNAAITIQANWRGRYRSKKAAALVIQRHYRAFVYGAETRRVYLHVREACVTVQAGFRGMRVRKELKKRNTAATIIQSSVRMFLCRKQYFLLQSSAIIIQSRYRAFIACKTQQNEYRALKKAAITIQAAHRGFRVRDGLKKRHNAARAIQAQFRMHRMRMVYLAMCLSAVIIQRYYRSCVLQRQERENFLKARHSAVVLQAAFRGHCVRSSITKMHKAVTVIQANYKRYKQQSAFRRQRWAACVLQQRFRAQRRRNVELQHYQEVRQAVITLQAAVRGMKSRKITKERYHAASVVQRAYRAYSERKQYLILKSSVLTIQRKYRATRRQYLEDRRKVIKAQRSAKRWLSHRHKAASVIQQAIRKFLLLRRQRRVQQGITRAQALWRGHCSRRLNDNLKVVKLRHRLREVSADVREEDKLCNKTSSALNYLLQYKQFSYILEALKNLETATRLSPECCERLVESGATNVIFTLIRCCNRSVPCMEVITFSIQILLNLSKYHKTTEAVYSVENSVETLLDLLQRYREKAGDKVAEKGGSIFTKACFLLALLLQDKHRAVEVMKLPKVLDRIHSIYRLTARKHKMDAERTVVKQKMNLSINGSFFVQATPLGFNTLSLVSRFVPDWVLTKDKLKDIVDPLRAIKMVANTLSIVL